MLIAHHSSPGLPDSQQRTILDPELDHHRVPQTRMRYLVEQHHPAVLSRPLVAPGAGDVDDLVAAEAALLRDHHGPPPRFEREDPSLGTRRVFQSAQGEKEDRADEEPPRVEPPKHAAIIRTVTRGEIEERLIAIVRQEKNVADELLKPETALADAGIDSLDALTILFAIEEQFRISIPDDEARAARTFGDLINIIASRIED